jgi:hypothetical protein
MLFVASPIIIGATPKSKLKVKRSVEPAFSPYDVVIIDGVPYVSGREPHDLGTVEGTSDDTASLNNSTIKDIANDSKWMTLHFAASPKPSEGAGHGASSN